MDTVEKQELASRTRQRNALTWLSLDYGGIMAPLSTLEADLDALASPSIENYMAISDEAWGIKEGQRDQTIEFGQAEVDQDRVLAEAKAATGRAKIAIERAADEYVLAAKIRDTVVKGLVMSAKEYASRVEQEQLVVEENKAVLAVTKEGVHLEEINAKIYYEIIQKAQVEADLVKAQVDVAKAHVRVAMAGIEAGQSEIELAETEFKQFMAVAEKAELKAAVAMIYAEIITKGLSIIKLEVSKKEIQDGFSFIQTKLSDLFSIFEIKKDIEEVKELTEAQLFTELGLSVVAGKAKEDLKIREAVYDSLVADLRYVSLINKIGKEWKPLVADKYGSGEYFIGPNMLFDEDKSIIAMEEAETVSKHVLMRAKTLAGNQKRGRETFAEELVNAARKAVYKKSTHKTDSWTYATEYVSG